MGWSNLRPQPRDAQHIAAELHTLLHNAKIPGPYVLVRWLYGGLYIRAYADQYREETAGLVLLDGSSPATNTQVLNSRGLDSIPLFVLTATDHGTPPDLEQLWQIWQTGFSALSTNSVQRILPGATHTSIVTDSTDAKVSVEAILQVMEAARSGHPLKP